MSSQWPLAIVLAALAVSAGAVVVVPEFCDKPHKSGDPDSEAMVRRANEHEVIRCARDGGHAVEGFGGRVVCLEPTQVKWSAP